MVAQLVEHRTENPGVGGSIPPRTTKREMEESGRPRLPWTQELAGSNPAFPTKWGRSLIG